MLTERLQKRQVGRHALGFGGSSTQNEGTALLYACSHFLQQARFANTWFSADKHDVSVTGRASLKEVPQLVQLKLATR